ncbi:MAG: glycosyltransferase family 39 protein [Phycisphaeraceae bacterium]|nr:glycosyltransferase family 39 protein [Phycisphaeraceae bacterium]
MSDPLPDAKFAPWRHCVSRQALILVALVTLARLVYIAWFCPYNLVEDEAQYWVWSLRPDWSYYSKGPGIAWSIWISTHLLGVSEWGVRAFAPIYAAFSALAIAGLSTDVARDRRASFAGAALFFLIPAFTLNSTFLMTIDGPMVACWAIACWAGFRALYRNSRSAWIVLGVAIGAGVACKYTILLLVPSLLIAAMVERKRLNVPRRFPVLALLSLACIGAGLLPIAIWNQQNGWPAMAHFLGHAKLPGGDRPATAKVDPYTLKWTLEFLGIQLAAGGPALVLMWLGFKSLRSGDAPARSSATYLAAMGCTTFVFYFFATFLTSVEANWAIGGFVSLSALGAVAVVRGMDDWRVRMERWRATPPAERTREGVFLKRPETASQIAWHFTLFYGIAAAILILRLDLIARIPGIEGRVALHRLMGAPQFADALGKLEKEHTDPVEGPLLLISYHYGVAAQLTFYLPDHPMVYVAGSHLGYRRTQWDLWPDMSLSQPALLGKNALLIGASAPQWEPAFRSLTDLGHQPADLRRDRWVYFGRGFLGFDRSKGTGS